MKRVLVVDDVQLICTLCQNTLHEGGYEVVTQLSGARCLSYLKSQGEEPVDLIVLDVEMPYMNGFQVLSKIRQIPELKELPVMFLTSSCTKETVSKAIELGAVDYLKKPFNSEELLRRVNAVLRGSAPAASPAEQPAASENAAGSDNAPADISGTPEATEATAAEASDEPEAPAPQPKRYGE